jgi:CubicO group peptidase (beta-lactamase class C family)
MTFSTRNFAFPALVAGLLFSCIAFAQNKQAAQARPSVVSHALDMTLQSPESVGFSSERLERLHAYMQKAVDDKQFAGIVTFLARHGKVIDFQTYGLKDIASAAPMTKDTIFRDFSMTKPVTGVAMMILYEQGKWLPSDPISKFVPELAHLKVYEGMDAAGNIILKDPDHQPTMGELMSHTAGFTYGFFGNTPVDHMVLDAKLLESKDLQEFIDKLAKLPLLYEPGKGWNYSVSMDVEGYIVEKLSGKSLPDFMHDSIYQPLGMKDAGFFVPADKLSRFATNYYWDGKDGITDKPNGNLPQRGYDTQPSMPSGGGGMVSTIEDYYRFAQMLGNGGELDGKRILAPATIHLMTTNHLPDELLIGKYGIGSMVMRPGFGYGFNGAVEFDPAKAGLPDGKGTYLWDGAAGTWFWVDPANDVIFIGMIQRMLGPHSPNLEFESRALVYQALVDPSK